MYWEKIHCQLDFFRTIRSAGGATGFTFGTRDTERLADQEQQVGALTSAG